ncbi:MAG: DNA recombination protein RmuC [bacterium]|nr:DNA recombination protein RmuC [bacterium]
MEVLIIVLLIILIILIAAVLVLLIRGSDPERNERNNGIFKYISENISANQREIGELQSRRLSDMNTEMHRMNESVSRKLEQVHRNIGEIKSLNNDVGDLKKILSNVKTRGILGELQLKGILEEILSPVQYEENCCPIPGSRNVVEFAVKLPGHTDEPVYLPIDSKFPGTIYHDLCDAYDSGDNDEIDEKRKLLIAQLTREAADIHNKYIEPPFTTEFAIMFLPFEGLYNEAVSLGMIEILLRKYRVSIAGPSTMAALLNSLLLGFNTLAIEKRAGEVWSILSGVKQEFEKFGDVLETARKHTEMLARDLEKLQTTRTNAVMKKLKDVETPEF